MIGKSGAFVVGVLLGTVSPIGIAHAQSDAVGADQDSSGVADIIVTAQRKDGSLARTPVAVAVVSQEIMQKAQVRSEVDLRFATPGLQISSGESSSTINLSLRGQAQDPSSDTRPGVLPYFNEIPVAGQASSTALYDLQSVQVLKGPQGTLFGRSATGGAVLFTTAKPGKDFGGYISGLLGNYAAKQAEGAVNVPLVADTLLARIAGYYSDRNGMQTNLYDGKRVGDLKRWSVRGSLAYTSGDFENLTVIDHFDADGQNVASVVSGLLQQPTGTYFPAQLLYSGTATPTATLTGECTLQIVGGIPGGCPPVAPAIAAFYTSYFSDPKHPNSGLTGVLAAQQARGPYKVNYNSQNLVKANIDKFTNTSTLQLGDVTLKNIFGFIDSRVLSTNDPDATPYAIQATIYGSYNGLRQYTDEFQISGKAFDDRLTYVVGAFFSDEKNDYRYTGTVFDILFGGVPLGLHYGLSSRTWAGFGQGTYALNDNGLSVTAGVRYTDEKVGIDYYADDLNNALCTPGSTVFKCSQRRTFTNWNYTFGLQNQVNSAWLLYAVTRQAYRNGGYNGHIPPRVGTGPQGGNGYDAQRVRDAEIGTKFQGRAGNIPVRANLALFYSWISNDQRVAYVPTPGALNLNIPKGKTYGLELDGQVQPTEWLTLGGTFNYVHASYTDGVGIIANTGTPTPILYDRIPNTPKVSGTLFADVTVPIATDMNVVLHGDVYNQAKSFTSPRSFNNAGTTVPSYTLANFRVGLENKAGWSLTANLRNAFDKTYYTGGFALGEAYQLNTLVPGDRRTITVEARYKF